MTWISRPRAWIRPLLLGLALWPARAAAQGWRETQVWGVAVASQPAVFAGGLGFAVRDRGRTRIGGALAAGATEDGLAAGRAEVTWHFLLDPARRKGLGVYAGGGLALSLIEQGHVRPWVQAALGVETAPATRRSFFLEAGFGGGARLAMGLRFRSQKKR
jgi:hypothetical protein